MPDDVKPLDFYEAQDQPVAPGVRHLMVCCGPRCNDESTNQLNYRRFLRKLAQAFPKGYDEHVKITPVECTGICVQGTCAYVAPDDVYYHDISGFAVDAIVNQHLKAGNVVEHLVLHDRPNTTG